MRCWQERAIRLAGLGFLVGIAVVLLFSNACGSGSPGSSLNRTSAGSGTGAPTTYSFLAVLPLENTSFSQIIGDTTDAPFLNSLINYQGSNPSAPGALATNYYAAVHPSIGDYFMMTTGQLVTTDDAFNPNSIG